LEIIKNLDIRANKFEFEPELTAKLLKRGINIKEVPISYGKRRGSPSKLNAVIDGWRHFAFLVCCWIDTAKRSMPGKNR